MHRQQMAGALAAADAFPVADDHAIAVTAVIVRVHRQHRVRVLHHVGQAARALFRLGGMEVIDAAQLHVRHVHHGLVHRHGGDGNGAVLILPCIGVGFVDTGLLPRPLHGRR